MTIKTNKIRALRDINVFSLDIRGISETSSTVLLRTLLLSLKAVIFWGNTLESILFVLGAGIYWNLEV